MENIDCKKIAYHLNYCESKIDGYDYKIRLPQATFGSPNKLYTRGTILFKMHDSCEEDYKTIDKFDFNGHLISFRYIVKVIEENPEILKDGIICQELRFFDKIKGEEVLEYSLTDTKIREFKMSDYLPVKKKKTRKKKIDEDDEGIKE